MSIEHPYFKARSEQIRHELKDWEKLFAAANAGRKASRDDIKGCPDIAAKYKEYNRLRDILTGKLKPPRSPVAQKKRTVNEGLTTPSKRRVVPSTPSKDHTFIVGTPSKVARLDLAATPSTKLATPATSRAIIGPTPQRNGVAIGLFDMMTSETPSKTDRIVLEELQVNVLQTPSRKQQRSKDDPYSTGRCKGSRTPMSDGKKFFLDRYIATPLKRKRQEEDEESIQHHSTPTFLRRDTSLNTIIKGREDSTPRNAPWKRTGLVRSLSSMIRGLKERKEEDTRQEEQMEEDRLDEELEMLREMEAEEAGVDIRPIKKPKVLVPDSQAVEMPLGPDQFEESDEASDTQKEPRRVWKKRGQKRQTKRVNMRPNRMKPSTVPGINEESSEDETAVQDTQAAEELPDDLYMDEEGETTEPRADSVGGKAKKEGGKSSQTQEGTVKKVVRKVNEHAHANYRRLKIKSKNAKGKGKGGFGRGRR